MEEFLKWARRAGIPQVVAEKCAREHSTGDVYAYLCAQRAMAHMQAPQRREQERGPTRRRRLAWQWLSLAASAVLTLLPNPLAALAGAPVAVALYAARRNTAPLWTEGGALVWKSPVGLLRLRAYRVEAVFRDVHGLGSHDFANAVRAFTAAANGIWYDGERAYVLLREGADVEEARAALRRIGVVVGGEGELPDIPRRAPGLLPALAHFALVAFNQLALAPALTALVLSLVDRGGVVEGAIEHNRLLSAVLREDEVRAIAATSQLSLRRALVAWAWWPGFYDLLNRTAARQEWRAKVLASVWRWLSTEVLHGVRQRLMARGERAYAAAGFVEGTSAAFEAGRGRSVPALTYDLAEFTPFSLMLLPYECGPGAVRLGVDDAGREVCWRPEHSPHVVVVGKTGSGKTTWAQHLARQLGVAVAAIDPHGHWRGDASVDARRFSPPLAVGLDDVDYLLDVLRAAGVAVYDVHYTVLLRAVEKCGGEAPLARLPDCLMAVRDITNAWAVDGIYGRLRLLAFAQTADVSVEGRRWVVVHTGGSTSPGDVMRLVAWLYFFVAWGKRTCPRPPCPLRLLLAIDEGHVLMRHLDALVKAYRELRKFGVAVATLTQSVRDLPRDVVENAGLVAVLAIDPSAVAETAAATGIDARVLERVAYESLPEERVAVVRFGGRAPIYIRLPPPP